MAQVPTPLDLHCAYAAALRGCNLSCTCELKTTAELLDSREANHASLGVSNLVGTSKKCRQHRPAAAWQQEMSGTDAGIIKQVRW
jgi:hypothetical protein